MNADLNHQMIAEVQKGGQAYVRNLAMAEAAVLNGQFNVAKVLRASAHTQRVLATQAARLLAAGWDAVNVLEIILTELEEGTTTEVLAVAPDFDRATQARLKQFIVVRERLRDVIRRSLTSLSENDDVLEGDVPQSLWGCYGCGYIAEVELPDACPICGALGVEIEWFGPFYSKTLEHLGQLTPPEISATLDAVPGRVASMIAEVGDDELRRKPSEGEWCVKEIIGHMIETDRLFSLRVKVMLEEQGIPVIPRPAPPWKLHEGKGYEELSATKLLERLQQARSESLVLVRGLTPQQWIRQGTLSGATTSVLDLGSWLANHDRGHMAQIRRLTETGMHES